MNPRQERTAARLRELIEEGVRIAALDKITRSGLHEMGDGVALHAWLVNAENILHSVFGETSVHFEHFKMVKRVRPDGSEVRKMAGVLAGALSDLEGGFLTGQEHLIAGEIFDSLIQQARHLAQNGFKDPAAVLVRVVLEDTLRRLSRENGLDEGAKPAALNDGLYRNSQLTKVRWRQVQTWLDIGNAAAHGQFESFTHDEVIRMVGDVESFVAESLAKSD
jgi:hypothetical protein